MQKQGKLFVIDGTDGSGKQTQFEKLKQRLTSENIEYMTMSFPRYGQKSAAAVEMYLQGELTNDPKEVDPYTASTFYAIDRYISYKTEFEEYYKNGGIILLDRYVSANMIHQTGKMKDTKEQDKFLDWLDELEFVHNGIPRPTEVFFLSMPPEKVFELIKDRPNKIDGQNKKDIHESNNEHIYDAYKAGNYVSDKYNWHKIECVENNKIKAIEQIHEEIYTHLKTFL